jgi:hypothetical protein
MNALIKCITQHTSLPADIINIIAIYTYEHIHTFINSNTHDAYKYERVIYHYTHKYMCRAIVPIMKCDTFIITNINNSIVLIYTYINVLYFANINNTIYKHVKLYDTFTSIHVDDNYLILSSVNKHIYIYAIEEDYNISLVNIINNAHILIVKDNRILLKFQKKIKEIDYNNNTIQEFTIVNNFTWKKIEFTIDDFIKYILLATY